MSTTPTTSTPAPVAASTSPVPEALLVALIPIFAQLVPYVVQEAAVLHQKGALSDADWAALKQAVAGLPNDPAWQVID
jgi:hypothetical protein